MRSLLFAPDGYGIRWSYDLTIRVVRETNFTYVVSDQVARTTTRSRTLPEARLIAQQILNLRPRLDWRSWHRNGPPNRIGTRWCVESSDGNAFVSIERLEDGHWAVEIDVDRNAEGAMHSYGWQVKGTRPIGAVQAQATAWAASCTVDQRTP